MTDEAHLTAAAHELSATVTARLAENQELRPGAAVRAAGQMAGTWLLRSVMEPRPAIAGKAVFADGVDATGAALVQVVWKTLLGLGVPMSESTLLGLAHTTPVPAVDVHWTRRVLDHPLEEVRGRYRLGYGDAAHAGAVAVGILIADVREVVEPHRGFKIACQGLVEGAKTGTMPAKPWWRFW